MTGPVIFVVTRNANGVYKSVDEGATFTQTSTTVLTTEATDIALGDRQFTHSVITYGDGAATTPYHSFDDGVTYQAGQNTVGKEVTYVGQDTYVFGSINSATGAGSGSILEMSFDEGISIAATIDVAPLFNYAGAVFNNIRITNFDFTNSAGGYITIAGDNNNSSADQLLTRTYDRGQTFPDALILPGTTGIIRGVWTSPERNVVFAIGEPDTIRGVLYSINPSLTEAPVKVLDGITVGSIATDSTCKFASVPATYNGDWTVYNPPPGLIEFRSKVYFLDSAGRVYYSNDYGFTWQFKSQISAVCVDIVALSENTVIVLTKSPSSIYKSVDGGVTFIENPQPSWVDPKAISVTFANDCDECNGQFAGLPTTTYQCYRDDRIIGTLCKSPYIFSDAFDSCVKASTIVPTNLILSLDYSQSVNSTEILVFREYIQLLLTKIEDRLLDQSMQVAIIGWSSEACLQQSFTSDINVLRAIINTDPAAAGAISCFQSGTNHSAEICLALRTMYDQSVLRPDAENVIVIFTDGPDGVRPIDTLTRGCDLSDIGILPVVPPDFPANLNESFNGNWKVVNNPDNMYALIKNAKAQLNNNVGVKMMVVGLGNPGERISTRKFFNDRPLEYLGPTYIIPSAVPNTSNYFYFDAGEFDTAEFIADQIRLGLAAEIISSPQCPDGCISRPGIDGLGYCECYEQYDVERCSLEIQNCTTGEVVVVQSEFLALYPGTVIKLRPKAAVDQNPFFYDGGAGCWTVVEGSQNSNAGFFWIRPDNSNGPYYLNCPSCLNPPWFRLTDCLDDTFVLYTQQPIFENYLANGGNVILHTNYPDRCFLIENVGSGTVYQETNIDTNQITSSGPDCGFCPRSAVNFRLVNCADGTTIYCSGLTNDLQQYIGQTVNIQGFGNACWQVEIESSPQPIQQDVIVTASYPGCPECLPVTTYQFVNCDTNITAIVYTIQDFSQYVGQVINLQEYPGNCWSVSVAQGSFPIQNLTISGEPYTDCPSCQVVYYQLTNCANPDVFLISTSTELARYQGRTITAAGYPGLCFTVTPPKCDCIRATINGVEYDAYTESSQFNGKNIYYITTDTGDELAIAWSVDPDRWELFERSTSITLGFSTADTECPFSNFWTIQQGSAYIITTVTFCADRIYNIAPELDFDDCVPCINCI